MLRAELKARRSAISDKPSRSKNACDRLLPLLFGNVMIYVSIGSELDTRALTDKLLNTDGVTVYVPYTKNGRIFPVRLEKTGTPDRFGNLLRECYNADDLAAADGVGEYVPPEIDCCVTPLLGINGIGHRIGYGKGCYDRFFAEVKTRRIGLAFECQLCNFTPDPLDVPLDCCVFETKVVYFNHNASDCG